MIPETLKDWDVVMEKTSINAKPRKCDMCDIKGKRILAKYNAKTLMGPWANMCQHDYEVYGLGVLGLGKGQILIYEDIDIEKWMSND